MSKQDHADSDSVETPAQSTTDSEAVTSQPPAQQEQESSDSGNS